jgi:hypothetical protein
LVSHLFCDTQKSWQKNGKGVEAFWKMKHKL